MSAAYRLCRAPLIWVRRDARDCAWSCFSTQFLGGQPWSHDLEETCGFYDRLFGARTHLD